MGGPDGDGMFACDKTVSMAITDNATITYTGSVVRPHQKSALMIGTFGYL